MDSVSHRPNKYHTTHLGSKGFPPEPEGEGAVVDPDRPNWYPDIDHHVPSDACNEVVAVPPVPGNSEVHCHNNNVHMVSHK